jgi:hypothetical protein
MRLLPSLRMLQSVSIHPSRAALKRQQTAPRKLKRAALKNDQLKQQQPLQKKVNLKLTPPAK